VSKPFKLPSELPLEEYPPPSAFIEEAVNCVKEAEKEGIVLRIMGGLAIYLHSQEYKGLWEKLGRLGERVFTDIDFVSHSKFRRNILGFFEKRGYNMDKRLLVHYGAGRLIYFGGPCPMVEVFLDKLEMNHIVDFHGRLEADNPTIPLAELLLEKLQIVHINEKDIKDSIVLLRAHEIGLEDKETINLKALNRAGLTSDWGFWYTFTTNLQKIRDSLNNYAVLTEKDKKIIGERITKIVEYLDNQPKSMSWKIRAKIGPKKKWYNEVEADDWGHLTS